MEHLFVFGVFAIIAFFLFKNQQKSRHVNQFLKKDTESQITESRIVLC